MTSLCISYIILTGLIGVHSEVTTVSEVSVKVGGSLSIPCLYEQRYTEHVKYLCKGRLWLLCKTVVKTNQPKDSSGRFSISDDKSQHIFIVTVANLTEEDAYYWCAVEIGDLLTKDDKKRFHLSVTGTPSLYLDKQEIVAFKGGSVTVLCYYVQQKVTEWCRLGSTCAEAQTGSIDGTTVTVNASVPDVVIVTMSDLRTQSSGWYWCTNGNSQMPVHITVHEPNSPSTTTINPYTPNCTQKLPLTTQHSSALTTAKPSYTSPSTNSTISTGGENLQDEHRSSTMATIIALLVLLLFVVLAAFFGWKKMRHNKTKPKRPDITETGSDTDLVYASVVHNQHGVAQNKQNHESEDSVTYSTIVMKDRCSK